jgi:tRNA-specific adenosine deaminase 2
VYKDQEIIARAHNKTNLLKNPTRHAEFEAIDQVLAWCSTQNLNMTEVMSDSCLYVTCEPCIMCASALRQVNLVNCVYGCNNERFGGCESVLNVATGINEGPELKLVRGVCEESAIKLLQLFYTYQNPSAPEPRNKANRKRPSLDGDENLKDENEQLDKV